MNLKFSNFWSTFKIIVIISLNDFIQIFVNCKYWKHVHIKSALTSSYVDLMSQKDMQKIDWAKMNKTDWDFRWKLVYYPYKNKFKGKIGFDNINYSYNTYFFYTLHQIPHFSVLILLILRYWHRTKHHWLRLLGWLGVLLHLWVVLWLTILLKSSCSFSFAVEHLHTFYLA